MMVTIDTSVDVIESNFRKTCCSDFGIPKNKLSEYGSCDDVQSIRGYAESLAKTCPSHSILYWGLVTLTCIGFMCIFIKYMYLYGSEEFRRDLYQHYLTDTYAAVADYSKSFYILPESIFMGLPDHILGHSLTSTAIKYTTFVSIVMLFIGFGIVYPTIEDWCCYKAFHGTEYSVLKYGRCSVSSAQINTAKYDSIRHSKCPVFIDWPILYWCTVTPLCLLTLEIFYYIYLFIYRTPTILAKLVKEKSILLQPESIISKS
jgi:hypothetical protein